MDHSDGDGMVVMMKGRRLHLPHRKFSMNTNFLPPLSDVTFQNIEMREKSGLGQWMGWWNYQLRPGVENCGMLRRNKADYYSLDWALAYLRRNRKIQTYRDLNFINEVRSVRFVIQHKNVSFLVFPAWSLLSILDVQINVFH